MLYLSQLLGKTIFYQDKPYGKIVDLAIFANRPHPPISKIEIKRNAKKLTISPQALSYINNVPTLTSQDIPLLPYDHKDFYLAEDLLDKQVIDVDGKRLVRVNDIALEQNGELKVIGIDIGFPGILRRLGLTNISVQSKIIPWQFIEAFDYQTGNIQIKLSQNKLNSLHPSEIADILEDVGIKERLGIVAALDARKAAQAIEETDSQTQISILEELPTSGFKEVLNKMHASELADVLDYLNPLKTQEIERALTEEKAQKVRKLLAFPDDVAGGLMRSSFFSASADKTIKQVVESFPKGVAKPETVLVTGDKGKLQGVAYIKDLTGENENSPIANYIKERKFIHTDMHISEIFDLFTQYNLRCLPVVDKEKNPLGLIVIDDLLRAIEEKEEYD